jgi:spore maturation protein A
MDMMPLLVLWMGILEIAKDSNLLDKFGKLIKPLLIKLFPSLRNNDEAISYIASNIGANMLGLGSAATPFGLKAMSSMQKENKNKDVATEAMITFLILNTGGVTIIPTTVISLRMIYKSLNPTSIIIPSIIATSISSISGLLFDYYMRKRK